MIPRETILRGSKRVVERVAGGNGALGDTVHTIHVHGEPLTNPMPMDARAVQVVHGVVDLDIDEISPASLDPLAGILRSSPIVEHFTVGKVEPVGHDGIISNGKLVVACDAGWSPYDAGTLVGLVVVGVDIPVEDAVGEPTTPVCRVGTLLEANHGRVVAFEAGSVSLGKTSRGLEDWPTRQALGDLMMLRWNRGSQPKGDLISDVKGLVKW